MPIKDYLAFYPASVDAIERTTRGLITPPLAKYVFGPHNLVVVKVRKWHEAARGHVARTFRS
jgi:hypothetical protein